MTSEARTSGVVGPEAERESGHEPLMTPGKEGERSGGDEKVTNQGEDSKDPDVESLSIALASVKVEDQSDLANRESLLTIEGATSQEPPTDPVGSDLGIEAISISQEIGDKDEEKDICDDTSSRGSLDIESASDDDNDEQLANNSKDERDDNEENDFGSSEVDFEEGSYSDSLLFGDETLNTRNLVSTPSQTATGLEQGEEARNWSGEPSTIGPIEYESEDLVESKLFEKFVNNLDGGGRLIKYSDTWLAQYLNKVVRKNGGYGAQIQYLIKLVITLQEQLRKTWTDMDLTANRADTIQKFKEREFKFNELRFAAQSQLEEEHFTPPWIPLPTEVNLPSLHIFSII